RNSADASASVSGPRSSTGGGSATARRRNATAVVAAPRSSARFAASRRVAATPASSAGPVTSRWTAIESSPADSSASSADGRRRDRTDDRRAARIGGDTLPGQLAEQLTQQERVAAGDIPARGAELGVRRLPELAHDEPRDGLVAQRRRADDGGERVGRERVDAAAVGTRLGRPDGSRDEHGHLVEAREQELEKAKGARVGPLQIVDREQNG